MLIFNKKYKTSYKDVLKNIPIFNLIKNQIKIFLF